MNETEYDPSQSSEYRGHTASLFLSVVCLLWYGFLWALGITGCLVARKRYRLRPRSPLSSSPASSVPGVSILRPLKGLDTNLYENLESTFTQEYPNYEILLSVADPNDQSLAVVRDLQAKYPGVKSSIIIGEEVVGINPKVNNLVRPYRMAANDILWVLDSGVSIASGALARAVDALDTASPPPGAKKKRVALVHHVPFAWSSEGKLGSRLEEAFLNTNHARMYIAINTVAVDSCVVGKSNLYRRSDIERVNGSLKRADPSSPASEGQTYGLPAFGRFLAEDNMIASALWHELDVRHSLSCDVARNAVGHMSLADYVWRRVRWIRVRKHMVLAATLAEPFTECVLLSTLAALSVQHLLGAPVWAFLVVHYAAWLWVDLDVYASLAGHPLPSAGRMQFLLAWMARELMALPIWILAMCGDEVEWRGRRYKVLRDGEVRRATRDDGLASWFRRLRGRSKSAGGYEALDLSEN